VTRFHVVTTMNEAGWRETGDSMVRSFLRNWPKQASLTVYAENFTPGIKCIEVKRLPAWLDEFKARHRDNVARNGQRNGVYDYRFDCVKFAHKVAALTDFGARLNDGVMIWLDADTFTHSLVAEWWLDSLFPEQAYIAWLDRVNTHPECGFVMFRASHPYHQNFMERFRDIYSSDHVLRLAQTHDSFILQHLVNCKFNAGKIPAPASLSGDAKNWHHPMVAGPLGMCLDHAKGPRKLAGRSPRIDARGRTEPHWVS